MELKNEKMGDEAFRRREKARRSRELVVQTVVVAAVVAFLVVLGVNVADNLAAIKVNTGFSFLLNEAGFDIGERSLPFGSGDSFLWALVVGLGNTIRVAAIGIVTATVLGIVVGMMRLSRHPLIRFLGTAHVEFYRNIPILVLLLALYLAITELLPRGLMALHVGDWVFLSKAGLQYACPVWGWSATLASLAAGAAAAVFAGWRLRKVLIAQMADFAAVGVALLVFVACWVLCGVAGGWDHPAATRFSLQGGNQLTPEFLTLLLGLTLYTSASIAEIVRAGVTSVPSGQWEAGLALGLTRWETVSYVIFPQSMRLVIPPLASQYMNLTKNSSLAVLVGYPDLVSVANTTINVSSQAIEVILVIMIVYLALNLLISFVMNALNARVVRSPL